MAAENTTLRRLGPIELYSSSRHNLGIYRAVVVSARYAPSTRAASAPLTSVSPRFLAALRAVVAAHPMLQVGITGEEASSKTRYTHLASMDLREHVSVQTVSSCASEAELNREVARIQALQHDKLWEMTATRAPWRVTLVRDEHRDCEDVLFSFHHSLLDGTSGRKFHQHLLSALDDATNPTEDDDEASSVLSFPEPPTLPEPQEEAIKFTLGAWFMASIIWDEFGPKMFKAAPQATAAVWGGERISFARPYITHIRPVDFSPAQTAVLLAACRAHKTTLTGLIHALAFACFTKLLLSEEDVSRFSACTPIGLHKYMHDNVDAKLRDTLRVLVCAANHDFSAQEMSAMRDAVTSGDGDDDVLNSLIWKTAARVRDELAEKAGNMTHNNIIAMLKHVGDFQKFHRERDGTARPNSWECSNVGVFEDGRGDDGSSRKQEGEKRRVTRVMFSNGAMVTGAAVGFNVASAPGGHLTATLSWQEGVVGEELVDGLGMGLEGMVSRFCETQVWRL